MGSAGAVRTGGYRACDMPHWIALLAIVIAAWIVLAVVGGWLIGRGLSVIERRTDEHERAASSKKQQDDLRRAA